MKTHNLKQGSSLWHEFRAEHFGASEAAAMLGLSPYISRNELLALKSTGVDKDHNEFTKAIFQKGHDAEEFARQLIEAQGLDFYPVTCSEGKLSASVDGLTIDNSLAFEHKLYSDDLAEKVLSGAIPDYYVAQCQQVLMVTGADKLIFVCSDGTTSNWVETEVFPDQEWFDRIRSGWQQFEKDLEMYEHKEFADTPKAEPIIQLPALSIQIKGEVTVSNLPQFKEAAETFINRINTDLKTDEDFVNAEETVKFCDETEKKLESAKAAAIGQTASIDELMRTIDFIKESIRSKRLTLEKLVKTQKESIKTKIINDAYELCAEHQCSISTEFLKINFVSLAPISRQSFETACKNKRTLASLHNAVDTEVAAIKIKLDDLARVIRKNLTHLPEDLSLFRDLQSIITKPEDDFKLLLASRMNEQKRKEEEVAKREIEKVQAAAFAAQEKIRIEAEEKERAAKELEYQRDQQKLRDEALKEAEAKRLTQEESERIANEDHRKKIISETIESLIDLGFDEGHAEDIAMLILEGKVKHVSLKF